MLIPSDWRFVAEGNAHLVYRYVGAQSQCFSGMVLKLPKVPSQDDERLFHQHKFVREIVVGDPFSNRFDQQRAGSFSGPASADEESEIESEGDEEDQARTPETANSIETEPCDVRRLPSWSEKAGYHGRKLDKSIVQDVERLRADVRVTNVFSEPARPNQLHSMHSHRVVQDRGLVSPVYIPVQHLHLFEDRHTVKLRQPLPPRNLLIDDGPRLGRVSSTSEAMESFTTSSNVAALQPNSLKTNATRDDRVRTSRESTTATSQFANNKRQLPVSDYSVGSDWHTSNVALSPIRSQPSGPLLETSKFSFALLERDLVTPPVEPSRLLSVGVHFEQCHKKPNDVMLNTEKKRQTSRDASTHMFESNNLNGVGLCGADSRSASLPPAWVYFTCELKPKSGLPAIVSRKPDPVSKCKSCEKLTEITDKGGHGNASGLKENFVSRFTMQQFWKLRKNEILARTSFSPEKFFGRLRDRRSVVTQLRLLLEQPQNNWRLFCDGARLLWASNQRTGKKEKAIASPRFLSSDLSMERSSPAFAKAVSSHIIPPYGEVRELDTQQSLNSVSDEVVLKVEENLDAAGRAWPVALSVRSDYTCELTIPTEGLNREHPATRAIGFHASDIFPLWMAWSGASKLHTNTSALTQPKCCISQGGPSLSVVIPPDYHADVEKLKGHVSSRMIPSARLVMARCGQQSLSNDSIASVSHSKATFVVSECPSRKDASPSQTFTISDQLTQNKVAPDISQSKMNMNTEKNDKLILCEEFYQIFPTEIDAFGDEERPFLRAITDLMAGIIALEGNLFHRLLYVHALCEGQQHVAADLLERLMKTGWLESDSTSSLPKAESFEAVAAKLMSDIHGPRSLQELLVGMEADIARDKDWVFLRTQEESDDPEISFALRVQTWHYSKGMELIDSCHKLLLEEKALHSEIITRIVHWIYRYLIGRTFCDCSVMINVAVSIDDYTNEEEKQHMRDNRFVHLTSIPLSALDAFERNNTFCEEEDSSIMAGPGPDVSQEGSHYLAVTLPKLLNQLRVPVFLGCSTQSDATHKWLSLKSLLQASNVIDRRGDNNDDRHYLSIWYRLSVVDLDLKQPSKIPQWREQLDNILTAFENERII